ncbi:MAG: iron-only hydrogenase system regulator [Pseudodesulfovibrio sp.]|uniref:Transcriptional regulator n=1 Tax=Pseudodesulfovibrio aespoeensis (strain ATCC 700646 / DSM 10631 / Aspo-2) TaxID=643562 RepID=E6VYV2_PSEA9|nr:MULTISPECIES: TM1266 family iron-only hydrogenase system putative regulator [Pseudodesulfovibrio]MBU4515615.1 iron-only hydrogenase system regulator [Pseudomonadota bacterium]ADU61615.1 transcriptional regulator [Pseudodesulfovibrio aespoeensis Aspo-2]MBU4521942.1 iron-only hydrogenase system regulator [Pseudomonadota bacterium]MBU4560231.1 iron-only hydrogenase system regulator [Pseudomonadota bacterium]MBV1765097.1 iron-only hydrogenase system regulator [Pseudodesulfovibrio sp.]
MQKRIGIIGIIIKDRNMAASKVNAILSDHGEMIVGRMGLPFRDRGMNIIDLIIEATTDEVGALTGKLGMLDGVQVKSLLV